MFSPITPPESIEGNLALLEKMANQAMRPNEQTVVFVRRRIERVFRAVLDLRREAYNRANPRHTLVTLRTVAVYQACLETICDRLQVWPERG